jgi:hypothetical protein
MKFLGIERKKAFSFNSQLTIRLLAFEDACLFLSEYFSKGDGDKIKHYRGRMEKTRAELKMSTLTGNRKRFLMCDYGNKLRVRWRGYFYYFKRPRFLKCKLWNIKRYIIKTLDNPAKQ